jgi:hypothetical protein
VRTIDWADGRIWIIDQTRLPAEESVISLRSVEELAEAISSLRVRGAPALGVAGAPWRRGWRGRGARTWARPSPERLPCSLPPGPPP